jgi:hypothetical protein
MSSTTVTVLQVQVCVRTWEAAVCVSVM